MIELPNISKMANLSVDGETYKERALGEYWYLKIKYERLHRMIIKREAGTLDFTPNCPMEQWKAQAAAMGQYLYQLEIKAEMEHVDLDDVFYTKCCGEAMQNEAVS